MYILWCWPSSTLVPTLLMCRPLSPPVGEVFQRASQQGLPLTAGLPPSSSRPGVFRIHPSGRSTAWTWCILFAAAVLAIAVACYLEMLAPCSICSPACPMEKATVSQQRRTLPTTRQASQTVAAVMVVVLLSNRDDAQEERLRTLLHQAPGERRLHSSVPNATRWSSTKESHRGWGHPRLFRMPAQTMLPLPMQAFSPARLHPLPQLFAALEV